MKLFDFTQNDETYHQIGNGRMIHILFYVSRVVNTPFNYIFPCTETDYINTGLIQSLRFSNLQFLKYI